MVLSADGDIEVLVQDGGTVGLEAVHSRPFVKIESGPDQGTYDAMNKALDRSTGEHVWFLNGGDESLVTDWKMLRDEMSAGVMTMGSYELAFGKNVISRKSRGAGYLWHALPTSHQAIFYPGDVARSQRYDLSYRVAGDYDFTARMFKSGVRVSRSSRPVARFHVGGASLVDGAAVAREAARTQAETLKAPLILRFLSRAVHRVSLWRRRHHFERSGH